MWWNELWGSGLGHGSERARLMWPRWPCLCASAPGSSSSGGKGPLAPEAYFLQTTGAEMMDARERADAAAASAAALRVLAAGWQERFGHASEATLRQPLCAGAAGLLSAVIWQLADGAMAAPLVAHACVVADSYLWGCDGGRATVELELPLDS